MPYLPIDPKDIGRSYEAVIRVNSQSGKGGVAYLMKNDYHLDLPRRLQIEFSQVVQRQTDEQGGEFTAADLWKIFEHEYLPSKENPWGRFKLKGLAQSGHMDEDVHLTVELDDNGKLENLTGSGNGPVSAFLNVINNYVKNANVRVLDYYEHALSSGGDAKAAAYLECEVDGKVWWGVGIDPSTTTASLKAVVSAVNRGLREGSSLPSTRGGLS